MVKNASLTKKFRAIARGFDSSCEGTFELRNKTVAVSVNNGFFGCVTRSSEKSLSVKLKFFLVLNIRRRLLSSCAEDVKRGDGFRNGVKVIKPFSDNFNRGFRTYPLEFALD